MTDTVDIRNEPSIEIVDTYDVKSGWHLGSVCKTQDGRIIWEEGRTPSKDVVFLRPGAPWNKCWKDPE
jgi:hypothetical protein